MALRDQITRGDSRALVDRFAAVGEALRAGDPHPAVPTAARTLALLDRDHPTRRRCELELVVADAGGARGRCAAIINPRLVEDGVPLGLVGLFECDPDPDLARWLFDGACTWLARRGCTRVRGPVCFSTWHDYRLVTRAEAPEWIAGEPYHPAHHPGLFEVAGFAPVATYRSNWLGDASDNIDKFAGRAARARDAGYRLRRLEPGDLDAVHAIAVAAFRSAWMYSPIERDELAALYTPAQIERVAPFSYLGLSPDGEPVAFMYNYVQTLAGKPTWVCKTIAVDPAHRASGLYALLAHDWFVAQRAAGAPRGVAALMHVEGSPSHMGWAVPETVVKEYRLYELGL